MVLGFQISGAFGVQFRGSVQDLVVLGFRAAA